ncbi:LuxR C-terminal-related transcriptional regulator [Enterobacter sp. ECC-219]|uniref:helix-turn-helix transcriptional regulator n=1 Tax=Enterobacter sp. ECC-219 TaxID=3116480 RepID=UPI003754DCC6
MQIINSDIDIDPQDQELNKTVRVVILDEDEFFKAGLKMALSAYLEFRNWKADFSYEYNPGKGIDILFESIYRGTAMHCLNSGVPYCFILADRQCTHLGKIKNDIKEINIIYRHYPVIAVLQFIGNTLFPAQKPSEQMKTTRFLRHQPLTHREREVLQYLRQGKNPAAVAAIMGISERTVSTHKRAAMRKLNFSRMIELYHWMQVSE